MDYYAIGQRIRKFRKALGISQETLAEKVNISTTHMSHIETGNTKLSLSVLVSLANALEVRTDDLLYDESPASRTSSINRIMQVLDSCTKEQLLIIEDIIKATQTSLNKHL